MSDVVGVVLLLVVVAVVAFLIIWGASLIRPALWFDDSFHLVAICCITPLLLWLAAGVVVVISEARK